MPALSPKMSEITIAP